MGQAKKRGTFEQRKAQSISSTEKTMADAKALIEKIQKEQKDWYDSLSEEGKKEFDEKLKKKQEQDRLLKMAYQFSKHRNYRV